MKAKLYLILFLLILGVLSLTVGIYGDYFFPLGNLGSGILIFLGFLLSFLAYRLGKKAKLR